MRKKFIEEPLYNSYFYLVWDCSVEELRKWVLSRFNWELEITDSQVNLGKLITIESDGKIDWIIWVDKKIKYESLSHELLHLTFNTMRIVGIQLTKESEEAFTYLYSFYLKRCLAMLK